MLDDRKAAILRAVVEEYIETAQPVGSSHVADAPDIAVSSATVRNELSALEHEGYLIQPHTSAGRIPTDKGYRFFVDQLTEKEKLGPSQRQQVREFFNKAHGELETMLHDTSRLLAGLTDYAAVVVGPSHEEATIRSVQIVPLKGRLALVVAVLSNGVIEKRSIELADELSDDDASRIGARLSLSIVGSTLVGMDNQASLGDQVLDDIVEKAISILAVDQHDEADFAFVGGASRMAASFQAVDTVRQVLAVLEHQYVVVSLVRDILDRGLSVAIGAEHGVVPLADCAVVVAPYLVNGHQQGTIGVLGPTRMNYPQALAAVSVVGERLGERLSDG